MSDGSARTEAAPPSPAPSFWRRHAVCLLASIAYLSVFPYFERLNNPNENARVWMTRAIVEHHVLNLDQVQKEWGWVNDKAANAGHVYSSKAPGASFFGVPVLFVHTKLRHWFGWSSPGKKATVYWLRLFVVQLPMCVFLFFFARYIERITRSAAARDLLTAGLALGSIVFPYAVLFVGHSLAAACAFAAYMLLAPPYADAPGASAPVSPRQFFWAGLWAGLCVLFEYQAVLVAGILALYALGRYRQRAWPLLLGAVPPAAALGAFHAAAFGRPWRLPFGYIENEYFARTAHAAGFHGLSVPKFAAFGTFLFSADYGLFAFSPLLALGAACALYLVVRGPRREGLLVLAVCAAMFLFLSGMSNWRAGWCVGPRYIVTVAPFLVAALAYVWRRAPARPLLATLTAGLLIPSVLLNATSAIVYPHYPEQFNNPVFDLAFPLLGDGYVPYSIGWLLHLPGSWSVLPVALAVLAALSLGVATVGAGRARRWLGHLALALLVAVAFLVPLARYGRKPSAGEAQATALVHADWEPPRATPAP
ncbi:MAG TPA: hypothetical protein VGL59_16510 [Polyangia bacterium]|jgi:hypothetical protein